MLNRIFNRNRVEGNRADSSGESTGITLKATPDEIAYRAAADASRMKGRTARGRLFEWYGSGWTLMVSPLFPEDADAGRVGRYPEVGSMTPGDVAAVLREVADALDPGD